MTCLVLTAVEDPKLKGIKGKLSRFSKIKGLQPKVKFEVISKAKEYNPKTKKCFLCTKEKLEIINSLQDPKILIADQSL